MAADALAVVQIEITRVAKGSESKARKILEDHVITFSQNGNRVMVNAEHTGPKTTGWFGNSPQLEVRYQITVPRKFEADLKTAGGHIEVRALIGKLQARTSGGNISLTGCKGPVDVHTSGGSLNLTAIEGDTTARTSGGSIRASKLTGKSVVKTSGGSITLALGPKVAADVDLHTSAGHVSTALPVVSSIQGKPDKNALRGKVNGGGPLLTAHTSGGSVRLEKR